MPKLEVEILHPKTRKLTKFTAIFDYEVLGTSLVDVTVTKLTDFNGEDIQENDPLYEELMELAEEEIVENYDPEDNDSE